MTAKEKANELFNKIYNSEDYDGYCNGCGLVFEQAKDIAVIAVDEILLTLSNIKDRDVRGNILLDLIKYWQEVKTEIEKL